MQKIMNNKYLLLGVMLVLAAVLVLTFSVRSKTAASADYTTDVLGNPGVIVNFNQLLNINSVSNDYFNASGNVVNITNGNFTSYYNIALTNQFNVIQGHKYYFISNSYNSNIGFYRDGGYVDFRLSNHYYTASLTYSYGYLTFLQSNYDNETIYFSVIDLTQMFGVGNEPNLSQCQELFVADYYPYNTGTSISLGGLNAYVQGYNDALNNFNVVASSEYLYQSVFSYDTTYFNINDTDTAIIFSGIVGMPLGISLFANDIISIEFGQILIATDTNFQVGYLSGSTFVPIATYVNSDFDRNGLHVYGSIQFALPVDMSTLYIKSMPGSTYPEQHTHLGDFKATFRTMNGYSSVKNSFDLGYAKAEEMYKTLLNNYSGSNGSGGSSYMDIWNEAYNSGLNAQISEARKKTYTFSAFLGALFDVPVKTINSLLDFDVFGFNMKNFAMSMITISIVFAIVSFILVRSKHS